MKLSQRLRESAIALAMLLQCVTDSVFATTVGDCDLPVAVSRSIEVQVASFGAKPDDGIDDTDAIQSAINSLRLGARLIFSPGIYDYATSQKVQYDNVILVGYGAVLHGSNPESQAIIVQADDVSIEGFTSRRKLIDAEV